MRFILAHWRRRQNEKAHKIPRIDDSRLTELFGREVLGFLVHKELLSPEWAERLLSWRHTGFNVHSRVRAKAKREAERVGKDMLRPLLALERLSFLDREGKVRKASLAAFPLRIVEEDLMRVPSKGWAAMIRKVYEVDPMVCPRCGRLAGLMASMSAAR